MTYVCWPIPSRYVQTWLVQLTISHNVLSAFQEMCGLECGHYFCRECWDSYLRVMVMCEGRGQSIQCPASHCAIVVDETTVLQLLREPEVVLSLSVYTCSSNYSK